MKPSSWFPDEELPIQPVGGRTGPPLWVRHLVIVAERKLDTRIIRDVTFRPGLNVIRVADRPPGEATPVGHSVGKTLLARLIRYCLGERFFASTAVIDRIKTAFPRAYVLAEVVVAGQAWVVTRPLRDASSGDSSAALADDWRSGLVDSSGQEAFGIFQEAVTRSTVAHLPPLELPDAGRPARWLDLLAWLARDQECSYRHYNEWRDPGANSGTARLHRDDASLLIRWALGLLDAEDSSLSTAHSTLLRENTEAKADHERRAASLAYTRDRLRTRLGLPDLDEPEEFFVQRARKVSREQVASLERLQVEFDAGGTIAQLQAEVERLAEEYGGVQNELKRLKALQQQTQGEFEMVRRSSVEEYYATYSLDHICPLSRQDCPSGTPSAIAGAKDPKRELRLAELESQVARLDADVRRFEDQVDLLSGERKQAQERYAEAERLQATRLAGNRLQIERWRDLGNEADDYERERQECLRVQGLCDRLSREIEQSRERQESAREQKKRLHHDLSRYYDWTLKELFGPLAHGSVRLDARGLHPAPGSSLGANGAAVSTLSTVLGLDLACLTAGICGVGLASPFLIHDSPKEADMEPALYDRLFELALRLERSYHGQTPAFQYIVTTTSQPPDSVTAEPYTRLVLDARFQEGHLLGHKF